MAVEVNAEDHQHAVMGHRLDVAAVSGDVAIKPGTWTVVWMDDEKRKLQTLGFVETSPAALVQEHVASMESEKE